MSWNYALTLPEAKGPTSGSPPRLHGRTGCLGHLGSEASPPGHKPHATWATGVNLVFLGTCPPGSSDGQSFALDRDNPEGQWLGLRGRCADPG